MGRNRSSSGRSIIERTAEQRERASTVTMHSPMSKAFQTAIAACAEPACRLLLATDSGASS